VLAGIGWLPMQVARVTSTQILSRRICHTSPWVHVPVENGSHPLSLCWVTLPGQPATPRSALKSASVSAKAGVYLAMVALPR
jgi:hypothetical protein